MSVVTSEEIERQGYKNLEDLLRAVRSFYVINDPNYSYIGVRGLSIPGDYGTRVLALINGNWLNDSIYDSTFVGMEFPVDMRLVKRVEIIRGPSSSIYGNNAFWGVINVITKQGQDIGGVEDEICVWGNDGELQQVLISCRACSRAGSSPRRSPSASGSSSFA